MRLAALAFLLAAMLSAAAAAADIWTKFISEPDGFSIEFPYTPTVHEPLPLLVNNVTVSTRGYALNMGKESYLVSVSEYSNKLLISNPQLFLDSLVRKQSQGATVYFNSPVEVGGNPGREVVFAAADDEWIHARDIYASGKLYQVVFREKGKAQSNAREDAARFVKSFRFTGGPR